MGSLAEEVEVAAKPDVVIKSLSPGDGKTFPEHGDTCEVHYVGTLASNGEQFDSSRERKDPLVFKVGVGRVIPGWDLAIPRLSLGEKAILKIPSVLAYGETGVPGHIAPNSDLDFEVELLNIIRKPGVLDAVGKQAVLDSFDVEVPSRRSTKKKGGKKK